MLKAVDLFCGSGGLSAGLIDSGINVVSAYDNWDAAVRTYNKNVNTHAQKFDLSDVDGTVKEVSSYEPDLIAGGPPCQDFSTAGKRTEGKQANLTVAFAQTVSICKPRYFLMENVPQLRLSKTYKYIRQMLEDEGYSFNEQLLDASFCGVPQSRKRIFVFGWIEKGEKIGNDFSDSIERRKSKKKLTVKEYLRSDIEVECYYRHPRNYSRRSVFTVHEPSPTIRGVNRPVPPNYLGNHLDSAPPSSVRPLTSWERSRIQTFPSSWNWSGKNRNAEVEQQIGNAVPVNLAAFVADGVLHAIQ